MAENIISRRDFLKLGATSLSLPFTNRLNKLIDMSGNCEGGVEKIEALNFHKIGPELQHLSSGGGSDGQRSIYVEKYDPRKVLAGSWKQGTWLTTDGGLSWEKQKIPHPPDVNPNDNVMRHVERIGGERLMILNDRSISIATPNPSGEYDYEDVSIERQLFPCPQSICSTGKEVFIGGYPRMFRFNPEGNNSKWKSVKLSEGPDLFHCRSIHHDKKSRKTYMTGWRNWNYSREDDFGKSDAGGIGLYVLDESTGEFVKSQKYDELVDKNGPVAGNCVSTTHYKGYEILFLGTEGSGNVRGNKYTEEFPFFFIMVDGVVHSAETTNSRGLAEAGGGYGLVSPQEGIVPYQEAGLVYVSTWGGHIACASLDQIIEGGLVEWQRVTSNSENGTRFGSTQIQKSFDGKDWWLVSGGQVWGRSDQLRYQQVRVAKLPPALVRANPGHLRRRPF